MALHTLHELIKAGPECQWCDFSSDQRISLHEHYLSHDVVTITTYDEEGGEVYFCPPGVSEVRCG